MYTIIRLQLNIILWYASFSVAIIYRYVCRFTLNLILCTCVLYGVSLNKAYCLSQTKQQTSLPINNSEIFPHAIHKTRAIFGVDINFRAKVFPTRINRTKINYCSTELISVVVGKKSSKTWWHPISIIMAFSCFPHCFHFTHSKNDVKHFPIYSDVALSALGKLLQNCVEEV